MTPDDLEALTHRPGPGPHITTTLVGGSPVDTLADRPPLRDRLLFVGLNPSPVSVSVAESESVDPALRFEPPGRT